MGDRPGSRPKKIKLETIYASQMNHQVVLSAGILTQRRRAQAKELTNLPCPRIWQTEGQASRAVALITVAGQRRICTELSPLRLVADPHQNRSRAADST